MQKWNQKPQTIKANLINQSIKSSHSRAVSTSRINLLPFLSLSLEFNLEVEEE